MDLLLPAERHRRIQEFLQRVKQAINRANKTELVEI